MENLIERRIQIARINITVTIREMLIIVDRCNIGTVPTQSERAVIMINSCVERGKERSWISDMNAR